jgi:hypothetical protein
MHWELWALNSGNLIGTFQSEAEALAVVRELLLEGWDATDLSLGQEDESRSPAELPPPIEGQELRIRANVDSHSRVRRTA